MAEIVPAKTANTNAPMIQRNCFSVSFSVPAIIIGKRSSGSFILRSFIPFAKSEVQSIPTKCNNQIPTNSTATLLEVKRLHFSLMFPSRINEPTRMNWERLVRNKDTGKPHISSVRPVRQRQFVLYFRIGLKFLVSISFALIIIAFPNHMRPLRSRTLRNFALFLPTYDPAGVGYFVHLHQYSTWTLCISLFFS